MVIEYISLGIAIAAIVFSIYTWKKARPIEKQQYDSNSMLHCFNILSDPKIKDIKKKVAKNYCTKKDSGKPVLFNSGSIETDANRLKEAFNQASALYQLGLLNNEHFKKVYGGTLVRFWKILKADIEKHQEFNEQHCKHFEEVALELMKNGIDDEPYCYDDNQIYAKQVRGTL